MNTIKALISFYIPFPLTALTTLNNIELRDVLTSTKLFNYRNECGPTAVLCGAPDCRALRGTLYTGLRPPEEGLYRIPPAIYRQEKTTRDKVIIDGTLSLDLIFFVVYLIL